jgi:hypothetical protein
MPFDFTDAWHPTVNPSARMPVHHHRHLAVLGHTEGVLNEIPRHRGGTTIRLPRIKEGRLHVVELPGQRVFAPWWLPASDRKAVSEIRGVYSAALGNSEPNTRERGVLARLRDDFQQRCTDPTRGQLTVGEALWQAADALHRELVPSLPKLRLVSLTRSPARHTLAKALAHVPGGLLTILCRWARQERAPMWPLLAVATSLQGVPLRVRLHATSQRLDLSSLPGWTGRAGSAGRGKAISGDDLIGMLDAGRLLPGARLTALAEASLHLGGEAVRHFGNTYDHFDAVGRLLRTPQAALIPCCPDDQDSWHYADLPHQGAARYPLHLIELAACSRDAHVSVEALIKASVSRGTTVALILKGDLDASLRSGGTGLLG